MRRTEALLKPSYPHFKPIETQLAKKFMIRYPIIGNYIFDFRLPIDVPEDWERHPEPIRKMLISLKQRRIDLVIETRDFDYLIEFEPRLSATGLGQLLLYKEIYTTKVRPGRSVKLIAACFEFDQTTKEIAEKFGIEVKRVF